MNRVLYQLSYAAMFGQANLGTAEISFLIISKEFEFVKKNVCFFETNFGNNGVEVRI